MHVVMVIRAERKQTELIRDGDAQDSIMTNTIDSLSHVKRVGLAGLLVVGSNLGLGVPRSLTQRLLIKSLNK